jgi:hypothetical protein
MTPDFSLVADPPALEICAPGSITSTLIVDALNGFNQPVTLSDSSVPAGVTTSFSANPVTPPDTSIYTLDVAGAAAGSYDLVVSAATITQTHQANVSLSISTAAPGAPALLNPPDGATELMMYNINFEWGARLALPLSPAGGR